MKFSSGPFVGIQACVHTWPHTLHIPSLWRISLCICTYMNAYITQSSLWVKQPMCLSVHTWMHSPYTHKCVHACAHTHKRMHASEKEKLKSVSLIIITKIPCVKLYAFQAFRRHLRIFCSFEGQTQNLAHAREALWGSATFQTLVCLETKSPFASLHLTASLSRMLKKLRFWLSQNIHNWTVSF